jgi:biotin transport system substrate-specific component
LTQATVLADRLIPGEGVLWDAARVVAANLLLILCAHIAVPLPWTPVPVTGQTFGVLLVAALLGSRRGGLVLVLYLLEGLAGLPVFQPFGAPGAARFAGPTGGYLLAYPVAAFSTGWLIERSAIDFTSGPVNSPQSHAARLSNLRLISSLLAGEIVIFGGGCTWLALFLGNGSGIDWSGALRLGAWPFLAGELIKIVLVVVALRGVELAQSKREAMQRHF